MRRRCLLSYHMQPRVTYSALPPCSMPGWSVVFSHTISPLPQSICACWAPCQLGASLPSIPSLPLHSLQLCSDVTFAGKTLRTLQAPLLSHAACPCSTFLHSLHHHWTFTVYVFASCLFPSLRVRSRRQGLCLPPSLLGTVPGMEEPPNKYSLNETVNEWRTFFFIST